MGKPQAGTVLAAVAIGVAVLVGLATVPLTTARADLISYAGVRVPRLGLLFGAAILCSSAVAYLIRRWLRWRDELIDLEQAGRWLYRHGDSALRDACRQFGPQFGVAGYGKLLVIHVAEDDNLPIYGRREAGLPVERLESDLWRISAAPSVSPVDLSIRRSGLWRIKRRGFEKARWES